jgi:hypothetical protein
LNLAILNIAIKDSVRQEELQERFDYRDGRLYYKVQVAGHKVGSAAGFLANDTGMTRRHITFKGKRMIHARVVWVYHNGAIPKNKTIDHINRVATDDRIENLRLASKREQALNTRRTLPQQSGVPGVTWDKRRSKWCVWTTVDGKRKQVGRYTELEEAINVKKLHP